MAEMEDTQHKQPQNSPIYGSMSLGSCSRLVLQFPCASEIERFSHFLARYINTSTWETFYRWKLYYAATCLYLPFVSWNAFAVNQLSVNGDCPIGSAACWRLTGSVYIKSAIWRIFLILLSCLENGSRDETNWMVIRGKMRFAFQCRRCYRHLQQQKTQQRKIV